MFYFFFYLMTNNKENQTLFNLLIATLKNNVYIHLCLSLILSVRLNDFYYPVLMEKKGKSYNLK